MTEKHRHRERDDRAKRERQRQTERQTDRQIEGETDRRRQRDTHRHRERERQRQTNRQTGQTADLNFCVLGTTPRVFQLEIPQLTVLRQSTTQKSQQKE